MENTGKVKINGRTFQEEVVAVRQGNHIGISCHPELLDETLIHEICFKGKNEIS